MNQIVEPDLPVRPLSKRILLNTIVMALGFLVCFHLGRFLFRENQASLFDYISDNSFYIVAGFIIIFIFSYWYKFNRVKVICTIGINTDKSFITIDYRNLFSKKVRQQIIERENLVFVYKPEKPEIEIAGKLSEFFEINSTTGFSSEKLIELKEIIESIK